VKCQAAKLAYKEAKDDLDSAFIDLRLLIAEGRAQDRPLPLFDKKDGDDAEGAASDAGTPAPVPAWRSRPVTVLAETKLVTVKQCEKLAAAGVATLGQLQDRWNSGDEPLNDIKGIGPETADKFADAWGAYAKTHQELYGDEFKHDEAASPEEDPFKEEGAADDAAIEDPPATYGSPFNETFDGAEPFGGRTAGAASPEAERDAAEVDDDPFGGDEGEGEAVTDRSDDLDDPDDSDRDDGEEE
jgi:hypothetical protein